jgi:hypothetical protein
MTDRHEHLDEGTIHAWLDGALPPDESARVESLAASCTECSALVAEARGLIAASSRILSSLDAVPAGVIPGADADVDQLAALRARRRASSRSWWQDRRFAVAASLVLVAGVSSLVWRSSSTHEVTSLADSVAESMQSAPVAPAAVTPPPATAPSPDAASTRQAPARDAKAGVGSDTRAVAGARLASPSSDSSVAGKVAARAPDPVAAPVANELRRVDSSGGRQVAIDSTRSQLAREQVLPIERQLRQEGAPRQAVQQLQADSSVMARRAQFGNRLGLSEVVVTGAGARTAMADAAAPAGACYRLRPFPQSATDRFPIIGDTVKLLNEVLPLERDPPLFRVQTFGAVRDTTLAWRSIDSVTVELRSRFGADSIGVRFTTNSTFPVGVSRGIRAALAGRVLCPG